MELKLINNSQLSISNFPSSLYDEITTAFVKDCPNVSGISILRNASNLQRIRCNIGTVSGLKSEIQGYASGLAGYDDTMQEQSGPRIVGTFALSSWYTQDDIDEMDGAIDGLTVTGDGEHGIDDLFDDELLAMQCFDSSRPCYNPAASIVLANAGRGTWVDTGNHHAGWFITKSEIDGWASCPSFENVTTVTDANCIVPESEGDATATYDFTDGTWFQYVKKIFNVKGCSLLESLYVAVQFANTNSTYGNNLTSVTDFRVLNSGKLGNKNILIGLSNLTDFIVPKGNASVPQNGMGNGTGTCILYCKLGGFYIADSKLSFKRFYVFNDYFISTYQVSSPEHFYIAGNCNGPALSRDLLEIGGKITHCLNGPRENPTIDVLHLFYDGVAANDPDIFNYSSNYKTTINKICIGDGSSAAHDDALLQQYLAIPEWNAISNKMTTWYDYKNSPDFHYPSDIHPQALESMAEYDYDAEHQTS